MILKNTIRVGLRFDKNRVKSVYKTAVRVRFDSLIVRPDFGDGFCKFGPDMDLIRCSIDSTTLYRIYGVFLDLKIELIDSTQEVSRAEKVSIINVICNL